MGPGLGLERLAVERRTSGAGRGWVSCCGGLGLGLGCWVLGGWPDCGWLGVLDSELGCVTSELGCVLESELVCWDRDSRRCRASALAFFFLTFFMVGPPD